MKRLNQLNPVLFWGPTSGDHDNRLKGTVTTDGKRFPRIIYYFNLRPMTPDNALRIVKLLCLNWFHR